MVLQRLDMEIDDGKRRLRKAEGVALDPERGHVYVVSDRDARLYVFACCQRLNGITAGCCATAPSLLERLQPRPARTPAIAVWPEPLLRLSGILRTNKHQQ